MDRPRRIDQLAVNKIGKKIKKTPSHPANLANGNVSKNGFVSIVPQLTKPQNSALRKIRPAALITQVNRPCVPHAMAQPTHNLPRPPMPLSSQPMMGHADQFWSNIASESPVSVCMFSPVKPTVPSPRLNDLPQGMYNNGSLSSAGFNGGGILPTPVSGPNRNQMQPSHDNQQPPPRNHHSPQFNGSASSVPILPSPRFRGRGILPTPRRFTSSTMAQGGILGPGKFPQPPHASPGLVFPPSPFGENTN